MRHFEVAERRRRLLVRHHLARPIESVEDAVGDVVGIHSSDPATVYLSLYHRVKDFRIADLDAALYQGRTLARILGMRRTLFVVPLDLFAVVDASCTQTLVARERRRTRQLMKSDGIADADAVLERAMAATLTALRAADEPVAARSLTPAIPELQVQLKMAQGTAYEGRPNITNRVLLHLSIEGHITRTRPLGSWLSSQYRWTPVERWLPPVEPVAPAIARRTLVERWLRTYGPAPAADIQWWTKWTKRDVAIALAEVGAVAVTASPADGAEPVDALVLPDDLDDAPAEAAMAPDGGPAVQLLPGLDVAVMGWQQRAWSLGERAGVFFDRNGNVGPLVMVDGAAVGVWAQRVGGEVVTELLAPLGQAVVDRVDAAAADLTTWFDGARVTPRFPNALERRLAGS